MSFTEAQELILKDWGRVCCTGHGEALSTGKHREPRSKRFIPALKCAAPTPGSVLTAFGSFMITATEIQTVTCVLTERLACKALKMVIMVTRSSGGSV